MPTDGIHLVTDSNMASYSLGGNVRYRPGSKMIKFPSVDTVYAVQRYGILRPIASEEVAVALYGSNWNQQIDDVSEAFFGNYTVYPYVSSEHDYSVERSRNSVTSINDNKDILNESKLLEATYAGGFMMAEDFGDAIGKLTYKSDGQFIWHTRFGEVMRSDSASAGQHQDLLQVIATTSFPHDIGTARTEGYCPSAADGIDVEYTIYNTGSGQVEFSNCDWDFISHPFFDQLSAITSQ